MERLRRLLESTSAPLTVDSTLIGKIVQVSGVPFKGRSKLTIVVQGRGSLYKNSYSFDEAAFPIKVRVLDIKAAHPKGANFLARLLPPAGEIGPALYTWKNGKVEPEDSPMSVSMLKGVYGAIAEKGYTSLVFPADENQYTIL